MKKFFPILAFMCFSRLLFGQTILDEINFNERTYFSIDQTNQARLFSPIEIAQEKVKSAYILKTSGKRDADGIAQKIDTLYKYDFDSIGNLKACFNYSSRKSEPIRVERNLLDTTIKTYGIYNRDTIHVFKTTYRNGNIIHHSKRPTTYHYCLVGEEIEDSNFEYDSLNRLVFQKHYRHPDYIRIQYSDLGATIRTYNIGNDSVVKVDKAFVNTTPKLVQITSEQIQISKHTENGLLFYMTVLMGKFPENIEHYEFEYLH
jgi:hypothetical protein